MSISKGYIKIKGDRVIWFIVVMLSIISLLTVYSSTGTLAYKYHGGNTMYYMIKHSVILVLGLLLMYFASKLKYTYYSRIFQVALYIAVPLLIITLFLGENINEATRVLKVPFIGLTFQTSDLAKITLIVYLAREVSIRQNNIKSFKSAFIPLMLPVLAVVLAILPANFSTAAIVLVISLVILFVGRVSLLHLAGFVISGFVLLALFISLAMIMPEGKRGRVDTWIKRAETFFNPEKKQVPYQVEQAKIAIASGGLTGKGPGNSTQRNFLPHPYSDFIYAIIIEEYGLLGGAFVVVLYLILFFRAIRIALKSPTIFGSIMVIGMGFSLVFQAMINMGVAVNLLPVTGQPLPLVSMGGTSLWFSSLAIGIILSVSRENEETALDKPENEDFQFDEKSSFESVTT
jgi:cell division protein FtsW